MPNKPSIKRLFLNNFGALILPRPLFKNFQFFWSMPIFSLYLRFKLNWASKMINCGQKIHAKSEYRKKRILCQKAQNCECPLWPKYFISCGKKRDNVLSIEPDRISKEEENLRTQQSHLPGSYRKSLLW